MKMNQQLLRAVATKLRRLRHEEHYDQSEALIKTGCGIVGCIAGWTVMLTPGVKVKFDDEGARTVTYGGREVRGSIPGFAQRRLGIGDGMAGWLFSGGARLWWPAEFSTRLLRERPSRVAADLLDAIADGKVKSSDGKVE